MGASKRTRMDAPSRPMDARFRFEDRGFISYFINQVNGRRKWHKVDFAHAPEIKSGPTSRIALHTHFGPWTWASDLFGREHQKHLFVDGQFLRTPAVQIESVRQPDRDKPQAAEVASFLDGLRGRQDAQAARKYPRSLLVEELGLAGVPEAQNWLKPLVFCVF